METIAEKSSVLGIDLGTTTVKVVLMNTLTEGILFSSSHVTQADANTDAGPLASEQDATKIFSALDRCMSDLPTEILKTVTRIGICGQMHGLIAWRRRDSLNSRTVSSASEASFASALDNRFSRLSNLYTWQDGRCSSNFLASLPKPGSHLRVATGFGCTTLFWLCRHEPGSLDVYTCAGTIQDFLAMFLCDLDRPVMTSHNAASWGYFDTCSHSWNMDILTASNFPVHLLPDISDSPGKAAGKTSHSWHGIPSGIPVTAAMGDLQCHMLAKLHSDRHAVLNVGTSSQFTFIMPADFDPSTAHLDLSSPVEYVPYFDGRYLAETASLNGGNVLNAFVQMLCQWLMDLGIPLPEAVLWDRLGALSDFEPGDYFTSSIKNDSIIPPLAVTPTLLGERHLPDARGVVITNAVPSNLSIGNVFRTLSRSIVANLRSMSPPMEALRGLEGIIGSGGALARNATMRNAVSELYGLPLLMDHEADIADSAVGAALAAKRYL